MAALAILLLSSSLFLLPAFSVEHQSQGQLNDLDEQMYLSLNQKLKLSSSPIAIPADVSQLYHIVNGNKPKYAAASSASDIAQLHSLLNRYKQNSASSSSTPDVTVFYRYNDFKLGSKIPVLFTYQGPSSANLLRKPNPNLKSPFSTNPHLCGSSKLVDGEQKACVDSFDPMLKFVRGLMGKDAKPLITPVGKWQEYTVTAPVKMLRHAVTTCHKLDYSPFASYGCHYIPGSEVHILSLEGTDGTKIDAISVCHLDTSSWSPDSVVFITLDEKPGPPICHFMATDDIVWVSP